MRTQAQAVGSVRCFYMISLFSLPSYLSSLPTQKNKIKVPPIALVCVCVCGVLGQDAGRGNVLSFSVRRAQFTAVPCPFNCLALLSLGKKSGALITKHMT